MILEFKTLCLSICDLAREETSRKERKLNSFLPESVELDAVLKEIIHDEGSADNNVARFFRANQILKEFGKSISGGHYAEDARSLDKLCDASKNILRQLELCLRNERENLLYEELHHAQERMKLIDQFLQKRKRTFRELSGFRIGRL